jgi:hypothetical protein
MTKTSLWPPSDPYRVIEEYLSGKPAIEICSDYDATEDQVRKWLGRRGVRRAVETPSRQKISARTRDPGKQDLEKMLGRGMNRSQIAEQLGVSVKTVSAYLCSHGIRADGKVPDEPSRRQLRDAIRRSDTKEAAADSLGISLTTFDRLLGRHGIRGAGKSGKRISRRVMTGAARAGVAEARARTAPRTRIVGTDMAQMISDAVAAGLVTRCPTAFVGLTTSDPLSEEDRLALMEHRKRTEAA